MHEEIYAAVQTILIDALGIDQDEIAPEKTLMGDLGAESIDLLDILFRLERKLNVKVQVSNIAEHIQGGIPDDEFADDQGIITSVGLTQLKKALPQIDPNELVGTLEAENVMMLFTVENLVDLIGARAYANAQ